MRHYKAHLKSGKCPKGTREIRRKGKNRCKINGASLGGTRKGQRRKTARRAYKKK